MFAFMDILPAGSVEDGVARWLVLVTLALRLLFSAFLVPITEELYFRGYLLPRMPVAFGRSGPVMHSFLFAVYHFDSPWMIPVSTLGLLPTIYATRWSGSVVPGIVAHALVNGVEILNLTSFR